MRDAQTEPYFMTGVFATPEEIKRMLDEQRKPMALIGGKWPEPERLQHEIALAHGLPEIKGFYGCDFRDGEFLRMKEATDGAPDAWGPYGPDDKRNSPA